jgi:hypothetical protein
VAEAEDAGGEGQQQSQQREVLRSQF